MVERMYNKATWWQEAITLPVIPVVVIQDMAHVVPLAEALMEAGLPIIEITLRTAIAWQAIEYLAKHYPAMHVGVGTLTQPQDAKRAKEAGAAFAVSPGFLPVLSQACTTVNLPFLPGVATATELMQAYHEGYRFLKCFPAEAVGGIPLLKSFASPFADVYFCPTGGIRETTAPDYLRLANVHCIGGSWIASEQKMKEGQWSQISASARAALNLAAPR